LLSLNPRPRAVFCSADLTAIGAMTVIRDAGLKVPEDIAVVGFDDIPQAASYHPSLTTIRQPITQIGYTAATTLIDILESRWANHGRTAEPQHIVLPTELIVRESCGQKQHFRERRALATAQAA
jgi:LacI family transcriptional regulator, galactose operon repressor